MKRIQIEHVTMNYNDEDEVKSVSVDYRYRGKVMRSGRGEIELDYKDEYQGNEDVEVLTGMVKDRLIAEIEEEEKDADKEDEEDAE